MPAFALALAGAVLLWLPAFRFRIDAATCATWPAESTGALYAAAYAVAVALLALAWRRAERADWSLGRALGLGAAVHAVALVAPPFTSNDPLFYLAIGRVMAHGGSPAVPFSQTLGAGDRLLALLPDTSGAWSGGTSPYGPLFNQLAHAIALVGGDHFTLQLRLYQALGALLLVATAALAGRAFGARAAAFVLFCPLAVVDGTVNPHNETLLALAVAVFALALCRRRQAAGTAALAVALAVKLSAALVLVWDLLRLAFRPVAARLRPSLVLAIGAVVAAAGVAAILVALRLFPSVHAFTALVGDPADPYPRISRSVEALPRAFLVYVVHARFAAWALGLSFRAGAALWIVWAAFRAARDDAPLAWLALMLLVYYLFLHAFLQGWYVLPLLPLGLALPEAYRPALRRFAVGLALYYALSFPLDCDYRPAVLGTKEFVEAAIVILPAAFTLLAAWRGGRARASAGTPPRAA